MVKLDPSTINKFVEILRPFVESEKERQSFLIAALGNDAPALQHISWGGSVATFIPHMLSKLADFGGREALCAVLEYARSQMSVHENIQQRIDKLIRQLNLPASTTNDVDGLVQKVRDRLHDDIQRLHGTMPLLGVDHWVDLGELFVDVNILEQVSSSRKLELDDLLQDFSAGVKEYSSYRSLDRIGLGKQQQRVSGLTVLEKNTNLMVLGKPGSGKTTYLQRIVTECNEGRLQTQRIPVLIKLRYFVDEGGEFEYNLERYLTQHWRLSDAEAKLVLNQGRALILLDGLDEVAETCEREIYKQIKQFSRTYPQNQLIVTCRTQSQESRFEHFDYIEVADFNELQVKTFAEHYFQAICSDVEKGQTKAIQFLEKLYLEENKTIRELAITPILLNLTCSVFHQTEKFYSKRSKLYEEGLELLLAKWDKSREIERDEIYRDFSVKRKQELLSYLAVKKFEQPQYVLFEQAELEGYIAEFLEISRSDSRVVLRAIEEQHGLLIERAQKVWSFSHLTFQEYLVAKYVNNNLTPESVFTYLSIHITNLWWHEIFILIVEILKDADAFIKLFKKEVDGIIVTDNKLQQILTWTVEMHTNVLGGYSLSSIRAAYIDIIQAISDEYYSQPNSKQNRTIFSTLAGAILSHIPNEFSIYGVDHESGFPRSFQRNKILANILICALDFGRVPTLGNFDGIRKYIDQFLDAYNHDDELQEIIYKIKNNLDDLNTVTDKEEARLEILALWWQTNGKTWITQLRNSMITYRNIGHDWQLSNEQKLQLKHYYKANQLLIDCLNSTGRVSNQVRKEIEETLLLPITEIEKRKREI